MLGHFKVFCEFRCLKRAKMWAAYLWTFAYPLDILHLTNTSPGVLRESNLKAERTTVQPFNLIWVKPAEGEPTDARSNNLFLSSTCL